MFNWRSVRNVCLAFFAMGPSAIAGPADAGQRTYDFGRTPTEHQIAGWDIDVRPDGRGLRDGRGSAVEGGVVYAQKCASCHGDKGQGAGGYPALRGGTGTLATATPKRTVGSFWPFATTLWDYIHRAMPFGDAQSLDPDQTYALVAYILYLNGIVDKNLVLDQTNLADIKMPNAGGFISPDPRPDVPTAAPCMRDCGRAPVVSTRAAVTALVPMAN